MIAFIKGTVDFLSEGNMILESHGIGYEMNIPSSMFDAGIREGEELKIYTHMSVREDGISLFGFLSREDLEIYRMLIGVSGIGPKAALSVLSTLSADNLRFAVLSEDVLAIARTPGIGKKTAQKLILEIARVIRLGFLQQNAFHKDDTCVSLEKQFKMMDVILYLYKKCNKCARKSFYKINQQN